MTPAGPGWAGGAEDKPAEDKPAEDNPAEGNPAEGNPAEGNPAEGDGPTGDGPTGDGAGAWPRGSDFVRSLARGLDVIKAFGPERPRMTLSEAARATGLTPRRRGGSSSPSRSSGT